MTPTEMRALATTLEKIAPHVDTSYDPGQVATYGLGGGALRLAADEIERLWAALSENFCPFPVIEDKTVGACVEGGHCGCGNRAVLGSGSAPQPGDGK